MVSVLFISSFLSFIIQFRIRRSSRFGFPGKIIKLIGKGDPGWGWGGGQGCGCGLQGELEGGDWKSVG